MPSQTVSRDFENFYAWIRRDFFNFLDACGIHDLTWQQFRLAKRINQGGGKIAVRSGQGPGKTYMSALVGLWRVIRFKRAKLVVTAPTMSQCKDAWLAQAKKHVEGDSAHPYLRVIFKFTGTGFGCFGNKQNIWGCILKTATKSNNIRGQHALDMDIIVEEASGCDEEVLTVLRGTQSNKNGMFLMIGNPSERDGMFFDAFHSESHIWDRYHWNAELTPESDWFDPKRNKDMEDKFGRESDYYRINVLGDFPMADPDVIIPEEWLIACRERMDIDSALGVSRRGRIIKQIGLDFARYGSDESCIGYRQGNAIIELEKHHHREPLDVVDMSFMGQARMGWSNSETLYVPDASGMGQGCMGQFYRHNKRVHEFYANNSSSNPLQYYDKITEAWFGFRELVRAGNIWLPEDRIADKQLTSRRYYITKKRQLVVESKDEYKRRGFESPDRAETEIQSMFDGVETFSRVAA